MNVSSEQAHAVRQWIEKAEHDLIAAKHILGLEKECPFDVICFHAQQCVEKYLKSVLVVQSLDIPRTHDLRLVMEHVERIIPLEVDIQVVLFLNRYAVETRYPGDWEPITRTDAEEAVKTARWVRKDVRRHLPDQVLR